MINVRPATALSFLFIFGYALNGAPAHAQVVGGYPPAASQYAPPVPGSAPEVWQYRPNASDYAPNGSTGYAPYSQDEPNIVVHDGSNERR
jgi:hypothetical protein